MRTLWRHLRSPRSSVGGLVRGAVRPTACVAVGVVSGCLGTRLLEAQAGPGAAGVSITMTPHRQPGDTGRIAWGHQDFTRYTVAACEQAVLDVTREIWRTGVHDTLAYTRQGDTLPAAAAAVARACGAHVAPVAVAPGELRSLLRLALARGDDATAGQVIERQLALAVGAPARVAVLREAITVYAAAHPARVAAIQELLPRLQAFGPVGVPAQYQAHLTLLAYWWKQYMPDSIRTQAQAVLALLHGMAPPQRDALTAADVLAPYRMLLTLAVATHDVAAESALVRQGEQDAGGWPDGRELLRSHAALYGTRLRTLAGAYWVNARGTPHPAPHVVSLIVYVDPRCEEGCAATYAVLRRLAAQYGAALDLALVTETRGDAPGTGPLAPAAEAVQWGHYYLDSLGIKAALLVDTSRVHEQPDGRPKYDHSPAGAMFNGWQLFNTVLVDRQGRVQWLGTISGLEDERQIQTVIGRLTTAP